MFMDIMLNSKETYTMVDIEATCNFISKSKAKQLGLLLKKAQLC